MEMIAHSTSCCGCGLFNTAKHNGFMFVELYPASNLNCVKNASNVALDINFQEVLPAVQMSCFVGNV